MISKFFFLLLATSLALSAASISDRFDELVKSQDSKKSSVSGMDAFDNMANSITTSNHATGRGIEAGLNSIETSRAGEMTSSIVSSLNSLTSAASGLIDEIQALKSKISELELKLISLQQIKEQELDEYRRGLFCSGCNKTKSYILAKGETFPHPGQSIIRPTPEQLAAKERELQAPIDQLERDLWAKRQRLLKATNEREEAFAQIGYGVSLWRTSISFENMLIWKLEDDSIATYKAEREEAQEKINTLITEINQKHADIAHIPTLTYEISKSETILKRLDDDIATNNANHNQAENEINNISSKIEHVQDINERMQMINKQKKLQEKLKGYIGKASSLKTDRDKAVNQLEKMKSELQKLNGSEAELKKLLKEKDNYSLSLNRLDKQRIANKSAFHSELSNAKVNVNNQYDTIQGFLKRGRLWNVLTVTVDSSFISAGAGFDAMGGKFRMGSFDPEHRDQVLPSVDKFITEFRRLSRRGPQGKSGLNGTLKSPDTSPIDSARNKLKNFLKCDPANGDNCPAPKPMGNPGGVRG